MFRHGRAMALIWRCKQGHLGCAGYEDGPCNQKQTNSNPKTQAKQKKRKGKK